MRLLWKCHDKRLYHTNPHHPPQTNHKKTAIALNHPLITQSMIYGPQSPHNARARWQLTDNDNT